MEHCCHLRLLLYMKYTWCAVWHTSAKDISHQGELSWYHSRLTTEMSKKELIAEFHRTLFWPVVVTVDGNINKRDKTDFIDRDGNYIILIPDRNIKGYKAEILGLAKGRRNEFTSFWNSGARFVVAGANKFSVSQEMEIFISISVFRQLYWGEWYHPIGRLDYFCTRVLHQEHWLVSRKDQEESERVSYESCCKRRSLVFYY